MLLTVSTDIANRTKPTLASSPILGLTVRATGEERTKLLDNHGNQFDCEIPEPTVAPSVADNGSGNLTNGKWIAYRYVYASTVRYPFVENDNAMGGSVAPRGNPSDTETYNITGSGNRQVRVTMTKSTRADLNEIWLFRTTFFDDETSAQTAADAGQAFYIGKVTFTPGAGTVTYDDNSLTDGTDAIELDNFPAPTFQFVWHVDPFFYGIGNFPFEAEASWDSSGVVTLLTPAVDKWYTGRDGQIVHLEGVTTGGYDGLGSFIFLRLSSSTMQLTTDGTTPASVAAGSGTVTVQGPPTTLYRSKFRNPFSWGETIVSGSSSTPVQWLHKIGGGRATAIFSVPNIPYLVLSTEYPAAMYALDLRLADTDSFRGSQLTISEQYSISSHWSQFVATRTEDRAFVMWGLDAKNYCILECDGNSVRVVSDKVAKTLRAISTDPSRQLMSHGIYDPYYQNNCVWFPTANSIAPVNWLVFQHVPTGAWFFQDENDLLCSAVYQDPALNVFKIYAGTQSGLMGQIFVEGKYDNWLPEDGIKRGIISDASSTYILTTDGQFNDVDYGVVGNWCLVTDEQDEQEQWARVSAVETSKLTFDLFYSHTGGSTSAFSPIPETGYKFYLGLIEISALKYFDLSAPADDKKMDEIFATLQNVDVLPGDSSNPSTFLRFYRERETSPLPLSDDITNGIGATGLFMENITFDSDGSASDGWITENPCSDLMKSYGIEIIDRGYTAWRLFNWVIKNKSL